MAVVHDSFMCPPGTLRCPLSMTLVSFVLCGYRKEWSRQASGESWGLVDPDSGATKRGVEQCRRLGILCLDRDHPSTRPDAERGECVRPDAERWEYTASYGYAVTSRVCPGLTFEMAESGKMTKLVRQEFVKAIKDLESEGVGIITGDCSFMMSFQRIAAKTATCPVFMSSMVQCPFVATLASEDEKVAILTASATRLMRQSEVLLNRCGFDVSHNQFTVISCNQVKGFKLLATGGEVDVERMTKRLVNMLKVSLDRTPSIRSICLESTWLLPYADALREEFNMPVFDAITCAEFFAFARQANPFFGLKDLQCITDATGGYGSCKRSL